MRSRASWALMATIMACMALLSLASRTGLQSEKLASMATDFMNGGGEEEESAAKNQAGSSEAISTSAKASARQVPTGPDPIHHHGNPIRHAP